MISVVLFGLSFVTHGFNLAQAALLAPLVIVTLTLQDAFASSQQPELFDDPLVGQNVLAIEPFRPIDGGFEGRVLLNGATWNARCCQRLLEEGERARVLVRNGQVLQVN